MGESTIRGGGRKGSWKRRGEHEGRCQECTENPNSEVVDGAQDKQNGCTGLQSQMDFLWII